MERLTRGMFLRVAGGTALGLVGLSCAGPEPKPTSSPVPIAPRATATPVPTSNMELQLLSVLNPRLFKGGIQTSLEPSLIKGDNSLFDKGLTELWYQTWDVIRQDYPRGLLHFTQATEYRLGGQQLGDDFYVQPWHVLKEYPGNPGTSTYYPELKESLFSAEENAREKPDRLIKPGRLEDFARALFAVPEGMSFKPKPLRTPLKNTATEPLLGRVLLPDLSRLEIEVSPDWAEYRRENQERWMRRDAMDAIARYISGGRIRDHIAPTGINWRDPDLAATTGVITKVTLIGREITYRVRIPNVAAEYQGTLYSRYAGAIKVEKVTSIYGNNWDLLESRISGSINPQDLDPREYRFTNLQLNYITQPEVWAPYVFPVGFEIARRIQLADGSTRFYNTPTKPPRTDEELELTIDSNNKFFLRVTQP